MSLPIRTTADDIDAVCRYLVTKPIGATLAEAKAILDKKFLDGRKLAALKFWGLIEDDDNRLKVTERGRRIVRDSGAFRGEVLREVIHEIKPYAALVEKVSNGYGVTFTVNELAAYWHDFFSNEVSALEKTLSAQAICFFHIAQAADLGVLTIGRRGQQTRFDFDSDATQTFFNAPMTDIQQGLLPLPLRESTTDAVGVQPEGSDVKSRQVEMEDELVEPINAPASNKVFITQGVNKDILDQVRVIVSYGRNELMVSTDNNTNDESSLLDVIKDMKSCHTAVIHVSSEDLHRDNLRGLLNIGAAMAIYEKKFVILAHEDTTIPDELKGIPVCAYDADQLDTMAFLRAFNQFQ